MPHLGDEVQAFKIFNLHFCMCVGMYVCVCTCHDTVAEVRRKLVRVSFHFLLCRSHSSKLRPSGLVAAPSFACWAILLAQSCSSFSSSSFSSSPLLLLLLFLPLLHKTSKLFSYSFLVFLYLLPLDYAVGSRAFSSSLPLSAHWSVLPLHLISSQFCVINSLDSISNWGHEALFIPSLCYVTQ